jgi:hypothetical protein
MPCCAIELSATSTFNSTSKPVVNVFIFSAPSYLMRLEFK